MRSGIAKRFCDNLAIPKPLISIEPFCNCMHLLMNFAWPALFQAAGTTLTAVERAWKTIDGLVDEFYSRLPYIVLGIIVLVLFWLASVVTRQLILVAARRTRLDMTLSYLLSRLASLIVIVLGVFVAAVVVFPGFDPGDLIAGLGITSIVAGLAFKEVLQNFFAGILILWRRPFIVGDDITVLGFEGTVEEINVRSTRLRTFDGERAILPNSDVYTSAVVVSTAYPNRRLKFEVGIAYSADLEAARKVIADALARIDGVLKTPEPWVYLSELGSSSVNLKTYFWIDSQATGAPTIKDRVATSIKKALDEAEIEIPFPHRVVVFQDKAISAQSLNGK